jgi:hypothetical protein
VNAGIDGIHVPEPGRTPPVSASSDRLPYRARINHSRDWTDRTMAAMEILTPVMSTRVASRQQTRTSEQQRRTKMIRKLLSQRLPPWPSARLRSPQPPHPQHGMEAGAVDGMAAAGIVVGAEVGITLGAASLLRLWRRLRGPALGWNAVGTAASLGECVLTGRSGMP